MLGVPSISEGLRKDRQLPNGALERRNDFGKIGYNGPCPPKGGPHRYFFKLYALDARTNLKTATNKSDLERAVKGHILAQTEIIGRFQHRGPD